MNEARERYWERVLSINSAFVKVWKRRYSELSGIDQRKAMLRGFGGWYRKHDASIPDLVKTIEEAEKLLG